MKFLKLILSFSLVFNQAALSQARAQASELGLVEVVQSWQKSETYADLLASIKESLDPAMHAYIHQQISKFSSEKLPTITIKAVNEFEMSLGGIIATVKIPDPFMGVVLVNNREIDTRLSSDPDKFYKEIRKALPRKTAQLLFELFFPQAEAKSDVTPTRVAPGQINAPPGAQITGPTGIRVPGYSGAGSGPGAPALNANSQPRPPSGGGGMGMMPLMIGMGLVMALMMFMAKGECKDVDKRVKSCEDLRQKAASGDDVGSEARQLASETRSDKKDNKCSGARPKLDDCMVALKSTVQRKLGINIGDTLPAGRPAPTGGRN